MKILMCLVLLFSVVAAQSAEKLKQKTSIIKSEVEKKFPKKDDIDKEITDPKMRADSGSKSKFSGSLNLTYNGASWASPFANDRPNVDGGEAEPVQLSGSVGIRYRIDKNKSLYVSTGISKDRPFDNQEDDRWEAKNPTLMFGNWFRYKKTQVMSSVMTYIYTEDRFKDVNYVGTLAGTIGTINKIADTRFNFGLTAYFSHTFFDGENAVMPRLGPDGRPVMGPTGPIIENQDVQNLQFQNFLDLRPMLQFKLSDRLNFYTSIGLATFFRTRDKKDLDYEKADITQTLGAGIAITRDFYLAPNIDFRTEDMRADNTSVNLSAVINVL